MGELARAICVLHQPSFNHFSLKSPFAADFKRWKLLLSQQPIDGESVHVEVFGDLLKRKQLFWHFVARLESHGLSNGYAVRRFYWIRSVSASLSSPPCCQTNYARG
jgi:hypothetical protein